MIGPSDSLKWYLTQAPTHVTWCDVLELTHPAWPQPYTLANWHESVMVTFEDGRHVQTLPIALRVDLPDAGSNARQDLAITVDNVGAELWSALELAQTQAQFPIAVTWRCYLAPGWDVVQAQPLNLSASNVTITEQAVTMVAERADVISKRWPRMVYRSEHWPGLLR